MTDLSDRQNSFEAKQAHDNEQAFKQESRAVRHFGEWVAEHLSLQGDAAQTYAGRLVMHNLKEAGLDDVLTKAENDLSEAGQTVPRASLSARLNEYLQESRNAH